MSGPGQAPALRSGLPRLDARVMTGRGLGRIVRLLRLGEAALVMLDSGERLEAPVATLQLLD